MPTTTLDMSSVFNGSGTKLENEGGPFLGLEGQSFRSSVQYFSQTRQFLFPVGPADL